MSGWASGPGVHPNCEGRRPPTRASASIRPQRGPLSPRRASPRVGSVICSGTPVARRHLPNRPDSPHPTPPPPPETIPNRAQRPDGLSGLCRRACSRVGTHPPRRGRAGPGGRAGGGGGGGGLGKLEGRSVGDCHGRRGGTDTRGLAGASGPRQPGPWLRWRSRGTRARTPRSCPAPACGRAPSGSAAPGSVHTPRPRGDRSHGAGGGWGSVGRGGRPAWRPSGLGLWQRMPSGTQPQSSCL